MCDTFWKKTENGAFFAKNSDRSCNEPNLTVFIKGGKREEKTVRCTYIEIPQVDYVNSVLLVKPSWIWGAEMGINDKGVAIGNEAVFTKSKGKKEPRLIGMDMLRLALERGNSAEEAKDIIIELLQTYGQGGNCGFDKGFYYDNGFLVTDGNNAYAIETAGKKYVVKKLEGYGNISNRLSIDENFVRENTEPVFTFFSGSKCRLSEGGEMMKNAQTLSDVFNVLRGHHEKDVKKLYKKGSVKSVCMHQSALGSHTTGSMVVHYGEKITIWITGASSPCLSVFKPVPFGEEIAPVFFKAEDSVKYWLKREYLLRAIFSGYVDEKSYKEKARATQKEIIEGFSGVNSLGEGIFASGEQYYAYCAGSSDKEESFIREYDKIIEDMKSGKLTYRHIFKKYSKTLGKDLKLFPL